MKRSSFKHVHFDVRRTAACGVVERDVRLATATCSVSCPTCYRLAVQAAAEAADSVLVLAICRRIGFRRVMQIAADALRKQDPSVVLTERAS